MNTDRHWMLQALALAKRAGASGEVPVGAVVVHQPSERIIGRGSNQREHSMDPVDHAEIIAIKQASAYLDSWRLDDCTLFVTLEPCPMCAGALVNARLPRLVFGASDPKAGACGTLFNLVQSPKLNHRMEVERGVMADEAGQLLSDFFKKIRNKEIRKPQRPTH